MKEEHKLQIIQLIETEITRLGSQAAVATKCGVSDAVINLLRNNKYSASGHDMWMKVAARLGWKPAVWTVVPDTLDMRTMMKVLNDAKRKSMFMAVANKAGSGKSAGCDLFLERYPGNTFYIECGEWSKGEFFNKLCKILGIDPHPGYPVSMLMEKIIYWFSKRSGRPLLIIDQANSLKPSVLSFIIYLYNECEDKMGLVLIGTPHLMHMIKRGAARNYKYYDEIDSRLGRTYITLVGATLSDVRRICTANGITDKEHQDRIWKECNPEHKSIDTGDQDKKLQVVEDMRRLKRVIQREQLLMEDAA